MSIAGMKKMNMNWNNFYKDRVGTDYQNYFEERYKPFLEFITSFQPSLIIDAGCGIGSVSKYMLSKCINCIGFDIEPEMVKLSFINCPNGSFFTENLINPSSRISSLYKSDLLVTHGVLEHFSDLEIMEILRLWPNSIHYVPLDKYHEPSFGDERLLPKKHWLNLVDPEYWFTFNNEHDFCFKK